MNACKCLLPVIMLLAVGCTCNNSQVTNSSKNDSTIQPVQQAPATIDSSKNIPSVPAVQIKEKDTLLSIIPADALPVKDLEQRIKTNNQELHIKITGLHKGNLVATLRHSNPQANIRFSLIKLPDGNTDGPFGQEMQYPLKKKGDYTLIISRSNMASGSPMGTVYVSIVVE